MTVEIKEDEGMKDKGEVEGNRIERLRAPKNEGPDSGAGPGSQLSARGAQPVPGSARLLCALGKEAGDPSRSHEFCPLRLELETTGLRG